MARTMTGCSVFSASRRSSVFALRVARRAAAKVGAVVRQARVAVPVAVGVRRPTPAACRRGSRTGCTRSASPISAVRSGRGRGSCGPRASPPPCTARSGMWHFTQSAPSRGLPVHLLLVEVVVAACRRPRAGGTAGRGRCPAAAASPVWRRGSRCSARRARTSCSAGTSAYVVDLVQVLPVGVVEPLGQQRRQHVVEQQAAGVVVVAELGAARVARRAQLDQLARC